MVAYTVHEPPAPATDRVERGIELEFVREGFSWFAFLLPPVWLAMHRLWIALGGYVAVAMVVSLILWGIGARPEVDALIALALNLLVGFEAANLKRWTLAQRGWALLGSVAGRSQDECERRFFDAWLPGVPVMSAPGSGSQRLTMSRGQSWFEWPKWPFATWRT
jgi:hypothetical protein